MTSDDTTRQPLGAFPADDLDDAFDAVWRALEDGASDQRRPFHAPVLVSSGLDGWPKARTVILRAVNRRAGTLRCHTDLRSPKVAELTADARAGLLFYDPVLALQVRLQCVAEIDSAGRRADAAWTASSLWSRRCYAAPFPPGAETDAPQGNLPADLPHRRPTESEVKSGRANFATMIFAVRQIDWLYLDTAGHRRARHARTDGAWGATWIAP